MRLEQLLQAQNELLASYEKWGFSIAFEKKELFLEFYKTFFSTVKTSDKNNEESDFAVVGFEDILEGNTLGSGVYRNTGMSGQHFVRSLLCLLSPKQISDIRISLHSGLGGTEIIRNLRSAQALKGKSVIDLGSGVAYYARALNALGAEAFTVDGEEGSSGVDSSHHLSGLDLNADDAVEMITEKFGRDFDLCNEIIIAPLGYGTQLRTPRAEKMLALGSALLKPQGYLVSNEAGKEILIKK